MSKIGLIVSREFNQRVRKKSFILTTILTPLLLVGLMVAPALVMQLRSDQVKRIAVVDRSGIVGDKLQGDRETVFVPADRSEERLREDKDEFYGYLVIGPDVLADPSDVRLYTHEASTLDLESAIAERIGQILEAEKLKAEKEAAELAAKQQELTAFAEVQGMDVKAENVASAIAELDYAALIAEANKVRKNEVKPTVAAYALTSGLTVKGEYGDLLEKA